jgi:iron complex outermembrane receptor protein
MFQPKPLVTALAFAFSGVAVAQTAATPATTLDEVVVRDSKIKSLDVGQRVSPRQIDMLRPATSDTASLLRDVPGVSLYGAGGVSSLPVINGMADDRLRVKVDGMDLTASCPNHMNPPLSYVDPTNVGSLKVYAGVTPVSVGGDSIGGSILLATKDPVFALPGQGLLTTGEAGAFYRSNGDARGVNLSATVATESFSVTYTGATAKSDNYYAGGNFKNFTATGRAGHTLGLSEVGSTAYETTNHTLGLAMRGGNHLFEVKLGYQDLPYQLYPNQRMDMLDNEQKRINLRYQGKYDWGVLEARVFHEDVDHYMDFGADKKLNYGTITGTSGTIWSVDGMPMYTKSKTDGLALNAEVPLNPRDTLRTGAEFQKYRLDDWWPPSPNCGTDCTGGMAPNTFWNINNGKRDRLGVFGELESNWSSSWLTLVGLRVEQIDMNTDDIQGYNSSMMYNGSSVGTRAAFNALNRKRSDTNVDWSALARYTLDAQSTYAFGLARKTRSPNLYERYSWSTNAMALEMNNFVGDGNGYVGNPNLKPEVAHTLSVTGDWHSVEQDYQLTVTPYYTHVSDYIDAVRRPNSGTDQNTTVTNKFVKLQYANQSARIYGLDIAGKMPLGHNDLGNWGLRGQISYTNGTNMDTGDGLYNIMPLAGKAALTQQIGGWNNALEVIGVKGKHRVSEVRNEVETAGYALVNLRTSYTWSRVRFDFGVENLFDQMYYMPLGGAYTGQGATMSLNREVGVIGTNGGTQSLWGLAVPGAGRSLYAGVNVKF